MMVRILALIYFQFWQALAILRLFKIVVSSSEFKMNEEGEITNTKSCIFKVKILWENKKNTT